ncbi:outer membrane beta-barrel protein [bacterium]|nr:outer membrane beta-barrel protein [bacterium]
MYRKLFTILILMCFSLPAVAQVEKGDSEIRLLFFYSQISNDEDDSDVSGSLQIGYGYFFTPQFQVGLSPRININDGMSGIETTFSGSIYMGYNFTVSSKTVPYLTGEWYQNDFSPDQGTFSDHSYLTIGFGVRNFFTEYAALNTMISYGFSMASEAEGGLLMFLSGISFIF